MRDADVVAEAGLGDVSPPAPRISSRSAAVTSTSSRWLSSGSALSQEPLRKSPCHRHQIGVSDPGAVETVARLALLVLTHLGDGDLVHLRVAAARDERRHAADRVRAPAVAGPDQQLV